MASDTAVGGLCVNFSARPKREERVTVDNNAFWGFGGFTPEKTKGFALCIKIFIFFALCKFYRFSMGVL